MGPAASRPETLDATVRPGGRPPPRLSAFARRVRASARHPGV